MHNTIFNRRIGEVFELKTSSVTKLNGFNENDSHTDLPSDTSECNGILSTIASTNNKSPIDNTSSLLRKEKDTSSSKDEFSCPNGHENSNKEGNVRSYFKSSFYDVHIWNVLIVIVYSKGLMCSIQNVDLYSPDEKRCLVKNLSFEIHSGSNLLITGKSCTGKTSLLRALR